ncbi:hypothetical protein [Capillimicrobium parvum]|uniref:Sulfotransferase family protein n=1 Tax=Capillimicrobium parvum TaxID=2884022 RepID=A0A9E7C084_9ACTN|nr:hypothetical protein [Capillimicrobium parvum]UGS35128.1 hypothetical protein DSM104329_01513 [Capillimicrobium parvum]
MTRTLFLHVGYGRCGTTAIQDLAAARRDELRGRGLLYLRPSDLGLDAQFDRGGNGRALAQADDPPAVADRIAAHVAAAGCPASLVSAEQLIGATDDTLARLVDGLGAHGIRAVAVVYVREQREWLVSRWAQGLKSQAWNMPLDEYLTEHAQRGFRAPRLDYGLRCRRLAAVFGPENLVVRRFARDALVGGDVRLDLFEVLGLDPSGLVDGAQPSSNVSPAVQEAVLLRVTNAADTRGVVERRAMLRSVARNYERNGWPRCHDLFRLASPDTLHAAGDHYAPLNEAFRAEFLPDVPAPVLPCAFPDDYDALTEDDCLDIRAVTALTEFLCYGSWRRVEGKQ